MSGEKLTATARDEADYDVLLTLKRVSYDGRYYFVVPDAAAGRRGRFSLYLMPSSPSRRHRVIGREITMRDALRIISEREGVQS